MPKRLPRRRASTPPVLPDRAVRPALSVPRRRRTSPRRGHLLLVFLSLGQEAAADEVEVLPRDACVGSQDAAPGGKARVAVPAWSARVVGVRLCAVHYEMADLAVGGCGRRQQRRREPGKLEPLPEAMTRMRHGAVAGLPFSACVCLESYEVRRPPAGRDKLDGADVAMRSIGRIGVALTSCPPYLSEQKCLLLACNDVPAGFSSGPPDRAQRPRSCCMIGCLGNRLSSFRRRINEHGVALPFPSLPEVLLLYSRLHTSLLPLSTFGGCCGCALILVSPTALVLLLTTIIFGAKRLPDYISPSPACRAASQHSLPPIVILSLLPHLPVSTSVSVSASSSYSARNRLPTSFCAERACPSSVCDATLHLHTYSAPGRQHRLSRSIRPRG